MLAKTHILGGVAAGLGTATIYPADPWIITAAAAAGALIPDICHTGSTIGKKLPVLSKIISMVFGHRTFTHSLAFLGLAAWLMSALPLHIDVVLGIIVGMASHLLLDGMTKNGIKLFYPLKTTVRSPIPIRTGGPFEQLFFVALAVVSIYWGAGIIL